MRRVDFEAYADRLLGPMYLDRCGNPITLGRWMDLSHDPSYKRVALTEVGGVWHVSTVWLGHNHGMGGPPLIFETMVFEIAESHGYVPASRWGDEFAYSFHEDVGEQWRYSTEAQAREGHEVMVRLARQHFLPIPL